MYLDQMGLPGGGDFVDVTAMFAGAAHRKSFTVSYPWITRTFAELDATGMIFADGYTLNDAMSALEVWKSTLIHISRPSDTPTRLGNHAWTAEWLLKKHGARRSTR
jgi:hypothetical protein